MSYYASCHGKDAAGDGPADSALKQTPVDLTRLARRDGGKYPANKVTNILRGQRQNSPLIEGTLRIPSCLHSGLRAAFIP
ncbi:MAG: hypothetical protein WB762_14610 [Candidatus Sulfotelmatobacter sp.]